MNTLLQYLRQGGVLKTKELLDAFGAVDRKDFVVPEHAAQAYEDHPLPIGFGQTISQPYTVAFMLELLQPRKGEKILDVGAGSGWTTALLAKVVGIKGKVYGMELVPELVWFAKKNIRKYQFQHAQIFLSKKEVLGFPQEAPFDKILVSAGAEELPRELLSQLKENGILVLPVKNALLKVQKIPKKNPTIQRFEGFAFVPLRH